ncbi:MAG: hypothetical protein JOZ74_04300 [Bradyrhizobium sp.]|nr:hypothetical protein [Bradyrhizobium sp.]
MQEQTRSQAPAIRYAYKASLIGTAHQFELTQDGLSWRLPGRSAVWPYAGISAVRLTYRPVSMQQHRFRADLRHEGGARLAILSTSWQTAALMAPQDGDYRCFIVALHERMAAAGSTAELRGGLGPRTYAAALALVGLVGLMMLSLLIRALMIGLWGGVLFLIGFAALFAWQVGGFIRRNRPISYGFGRIPQALLP